MMRGVVTGVFVAGMAGPVAAWDADFSKGMHWYSHEESGVRLLLGCDPSNQGADDRTSLTISDSGPFDPKTLYSGPVTFISNGGAEVVLSFEYGLRAESGGDIEAWRAFLTLLSDYGLREVIYKGERRSFGAGKVVTMCEQDLA